MARSTVLPLATYPAGTRVIGPVNIQNPISQLVIDIARCTSVDTTIWPSETARMATLWEQSNDGGTTWQTLFSSESWGGIAVHSKTGLEIPNDHIAMAFFPGTGRQLRATLTLDEEIRTTASIDIT